MKYNWKVLVLEDDPVEIKLLSILLEDYLLAENITFCENFYEAVQEVKSKQFDVIFTDLHMPEKTGMDFIVDVLQQDEKHHNVPIIVISGTDPDSFLSHTLQPICFDFLFKPYTEEQLGQTIEKVSQYLNEKKAS